MNAENLLAHFERISEAPDAIKQLRNFILDLAVRGKLVEQDPCDEPASEMLKRIAADKARLVKDGFSKSKLLPRVNEEEHLFTAPSNWTWQRIGTFTTFLGGFAYESPRFIKASSNQVLRLGNVKDYGVVAEANPVFITDEYASQTLKYKLKAGDVLVTMTGTKAKKDYLFSTMVSLQDLADAHLYLNQRVGCLRGIVVQPEFIELLFKSEQVRNTLYAQSTGTANQANIGSTQISNLAVSLPPVAEQHRIVAKVDELMSLCDQLEAARAEREKCRDSLVAASLQGLNQPAVEEETFREHARFTFNNLARIATRSAHIKQLRQTILNLAVRGKLVKQDPTDEPASELLKRIAEEKARIGVKHAVQSLDLDEVPFQLPAGWSWSRIGEACSKTGSGSTPRGGKDVYKNTGIIFLRSQNIYDNGLRLNEVVYIDRVTHEKMRSTRVLPGDLLLNITGGSMGRCCLVSVDAEEANVSQHVAIIRTAVRGTESFLHKLVLSPYFQAFVFGEQTGAGRGGLPKNRMDKIAVALPPLAEQHRIVDKVDELMAICDQLEAQITATEQDSRRFLESVLADALAPGIDLSAEAQVA